jgi:hypothetical protein
MEKQERARRVLKEAQHVCQRATLVTRRMEVGCASRTVLGKNFLVENHKSKVAKFLRELLRTTPLIARKENL